MNSLTKFTLTPLAALALSLPASVPAIAGQSADDIVVRSAADMKQWTKDTNRSLDRKLQNTRISRTMLPTESIVQVTFTIGDDGRADISQITGDNANWAAKRIARDAVKRLNNLEDVPVSNSQEVTFLANIIFANDLNTHEELSRKLAKSERARLASAGDESDYIALGS